MNRIIENILYKPQIEYDYLNKVNHICDEALNNGRIIHYKNEVKYDPIDETLHINMSVINPSSIECITTNITLTNKNTILS